MFGKNATFIFQWLEKTASHNASAFQTLEKSLKVCG